MKNFVWRTLAAVMLAICMTALTACVPQTDAPESPAHSEPAAEPSPALTPAEQYLSQTSSEELVRKFWNAVYVDWDTASGFTSPADVSPLELLNMALCCDELDTDSFYDEAERLYRIPASAIRETLDLYFEDYDLDMELLAQSWGYDAAEDTLTLTAMPAGLGGGRATLSVLDARVLSGDTVELNLDTGLAGTVLVAAKVVGDDVRFLSCAWQWEYISARFGAPVGENGWFPLDNGTSILLSSLLDLSPEGLAGYEPLETVIEENWISLVELTGRHGNVVSLSREGGSILLRTEGRYYDCGGQIDFEAVCRALEQGQLNAVLDSLPQLTRMVVEVPGYSSLNRDVPLTEEENQFIWDVLRPNTWTVPDMYTAQDLARDWPDFVNLYSGDIRVARVTEGEVAGVNRTVIFYYIDGDEEKTAFLFAPEQCYQTLFDWAREK